MANQVIEKSTPSPSQGVGVEETFDFYDVVVQEGLNGKPVKTRRLRSKVSREQLLRNKESFIKQIADIDADIAEIDKILAV